MSIIVTKSSTYLFKMFIKHYTILYAFLMHFFFAVYYLTLNNVQQKLGGWTLSYSSAASSGSSLLLQVNLVTSFCLVTGNGLGFTVFSCLLI